MKRMEITGVPKLLNCSQEDDGQTLGVEKIASNITQLVGWTPMVELKHIMERDGLGSRLVGKIDFYQPLSSIKDRTALGMIEDAEQKGFITPGISTLVGCTGGNFGIGVALNAIQKDYKFIAVMLENCSLEKQILLKYLGVDVALIASNLGIEEAFNKMKEIHAETPNSYIMDQFTNFANPDAHFKTTGPEIWKDTAGKIDFLVCGVGSGGTLTGAGRYLKMKNPNVKIIAVEPTESAVLSGGKPGKHAIQGIGAGIIPLVLDVSLIDEVVTVSSEEALNNSRRLASVEGILAGISSGAALAASLKVAKRAENKDKMIVTVFASGGERYSSSQLFAKAREESSKIRVL
ncbi:Cysteine synthase [Zostera marina]|uniref:cysteine synthase n=1 Tax=Zostera marina TaxID=29655 RepID=A0A0K9NQ68_ZOSMR|nr:Cysteine synthase [Zostera marina]